VFSRSDRHRVELIKDVKEAQQEFVATVEKNRRTETQREAGIL